MLEIKESDRVVNIIFDAILTKRLSPGVKLTEISLQEEFGFSRNEVREGFAKLVKQGILYYKKNQGVRVVIPEKKQIIDIYQARKIIETGIVELLIAKNKQLDIDLIEKFILEEKNLHNSNQLGKLTRKSCDFHLSLADFTDNGYLIASLKPLIPLSALASSIYSKKDSNFCSFEEHQALVDAIKTFNSSIAVKEINKHLDNCVKNLDFSNQIKLKTNYSNIYAQT